MMACRRPPHVVVVLTFWCNRESSSCRAQLAANYMYTRALSKLAASDVTAMFATNPALVYVLSCWLLCEPVEVSMATPIIIFSSLRSMASW